jgi:tartrate/fumarate subfamily iron-sulfur-dependent hydro-lyase alpha chain
MTVIQQQHLIDSVADALQYISYYHPMDYIESLGRAYELEQSPAAKDAIAQILSNSRLCAEGHRPICQDTGIVVVFVKIGMNVRFEATLTLQQMIDEGVRKAYLLPENKLRASIVSDPAYTRKNTRDNTPAVVHVEMVPGDRVDITVSAKGGGSENKAKFVMLNPSDSIVDWVLKTVPTMGAGWCPPGMLGIGIGGSAEKAMLLAKESLMEPIDMAELKARGARNAIEELRIELHDKVNALGIGAQGLGGLSTVLDVKILDYPTHAASKPVAMIPNCAATRHLHFSLDGTGAAQLDPPDLSRWPKIDWKPSAESKRVNLDALTPADVAAWKRPRSARRRGLQKSRDLLRRPRRSGPRRSRRSRGPHDRDAHGQIHRDDAREHRADRHDRQSGTRPRRHRSDPQTQSGVSDGGRRCGVPGLEGDQIIARRGFRGPRHGSDLRVRSQRHARHGRRGLERHVRASDRTCGMEREDRRERDHHAPTLSAERRLKRPRCARASRRSWHVRCAHPA